MRLSEVNDVVGDLLDEIGSEALDELDSHEPPCLIELRAATDAEFRYEIIDKVDTGGMKNVFRAIDHRTCREVALAFIKTEGLSEKAIRYFIQESWVTAKLEHPNIVPIYDVGISPDGSPYFAMKLLSGESLISIIDRLKESVPSYKVKFSRRHLLEIFIKICDAVSYAHTCGVIHLDLKPGNIQVSDFGQVLVLDWGIASVLHQREDSYDTDSTPLEEIEHTLWGSIKGTPGYIAPELQEGPFEPSNKADIYGLGAILLSLLIHRRASGSKSLLYLELENVPSALCSVVRKAMQADPAYRYESVLDLQADVEAYLDGHATQAEDAGFVRQQMLLIKRNLRIFTTIGVSLLLLVALTTIGVFRLKMSEKQALKQEAVAQQMLIKYEQERKERKVREKTSYTYYVSRAQRAFEQCRLNDSMKEVEQAILMDPDKNSAYKIKMELLIAQQKFQAIMDDKIYQSIDSYIYRKMYQLAEKYAEVKDDSRFFTNRELKPFFKDLERMKISRRNRLMKGLFYTINYKKTFFKQQYLLRKASSALFPGSRFIYDESRDRVSLETKSQNFLTLLSGLRIKQLDLSDTTFRNFGPVQTLLDLEYLNLKNSKIISPGPLEILGQLKYLNLENTSMTYYRTYKKSSVIKYLNIARTEIANYPSKQVTVQILNAVEAPRAELAAIALYDSPPKIILITPQQLEENRRFARLYKNTGGEIRLYNSADDVEEDEFLSEF